AEVWPTVTPSRLASSSIDGIRSPNSSTSSSTMSAWALASYAAPGTGAAVACVPDTASRVIAAAVDRLIRPAAAVRMRMKFVPPLGNVVWRGQAAPALGTIQRRWGGRGDDFLTNLDVDHVPW